MNLSSQYLLKTFQLVVLIFLIIFFIRGFIFEIGKINGMSMENNYFDEDIFIVNKYKLLFRKPKRGEVVQFVNLKDNKLIIKRIIGLPGETIDIKNGKIFITNNQTSFQLEEPYLKKYSFTRAKNNKNNFFIKDFEYFVLGDNRNHSTDSRDFGAVNRIDINGLAGKPIQLNFLNKFKNQFFKSEN